MRADFFSRAIRKAFFTLGILVGTWGLGLGLFYLYTSNLSQPNPIPATEGIVVFTGGKNRLKTGVYLALQAPQEKILVSGVTSPPHGVQAFLQGIPKTAITLGYGAKNTAENAYETAAWAKKHQLTSLKIVTSDYHMARSLLELGNVLPHTFLIPYPVTTHNHFYNHHIMKEFHKLLYALCRTLKDRVIPR